MKLKHYIMALCLVSGLLSLTGCGDDDDNWAPGTQAQVKCQVYFENENPEVVEVEPGETNSYTFTLSREDADEAISVPLTMSGNPEFECPDKVDFEAGETERQFTVNFKGTSIPGDFECSIAVPEGDYNSIYTSLVTQLEIKVSVAKWELFAKDVKFTSSNDWLHPFTADLYKVEGMDRYRFVELFVGLDLTFGLEQTNTDGKYDIYPEGGYNGFDPYYPDPEDKTAWFFGDGDGDDDYFKIYPKGDEDLYLYWAYIYTNRGGHYNNSTFIDFNENKGCILINYYGYEEATDDYASFGGGYDYLRFRWAPLEN